MRRALLLLCACNPESQAIDALPAPPSLTITGHVSVPGAMVGAYRNTDATPVAATVADALGNYTLPVETGGMPIDYVGATSDGYVPTHLYLAEAIRTDVTANLDLATADQLTAIARDTCGVTLTLSIEIAVAADAVVSTVPVPRRYCMANGVAYLLGLTGSVVISVTGSGHDPSSRTVDAFLGTLTVVQP